METQIDHNAYSALYSDSEESESSELSALLANPDLGREKPLSIRDFQEPHHFSPIMGGSRCNDGPAHIL